MRRESPPAPSRITGLGFLMRTRAAVPPRGFIFHVSRCGSTLVSNLTRLCEQNIVVSEPQVFGPLLMPPGDRGQLDAPKGVMRDRCIRGAMAAFGSSGTRNETGVIIKLTSWQILSMGVMRRLWPEVPCLVVIRDPVEVMVSCLKDEPGWLKLAQDPGSAARLFGWEARRIPQLSPEQRCAMGLGEFYRAALEQLGPRCRILDYSRIGEDSALQIARYFGYPGDSLDPEALKRCLATYSKDLKGEDAFACDGPRKQLAAGADLRMYAQEYARTAYEALMSRSEHHLAAGAQTSCTPWPAQGAAAAS